jgi:hypothetical protein
VQALVHGAMFTRGATELANTALFIGGGQMARAEELLDFTLRTFFDPLRCSVMLDANGANTTAAAAVLCAGLHTDLTAARALVLGGTGPVGQRVALMLALEGAEVWVSSRTIERAADACAVIRARHGNARVVPCAVNDAEGLDETPERFHVVVAAAAPGTRVVGSTYLRGQTELRVAIDLNAVPPAGIEGVAASDAGREDYGVFHYGPLGVGGLKMKIHKAAVQTLFTSNQHVLDAEQVLAIGRKLSAS